MKKHKCKIAGSVGAVAGAPYVLSAAGFGAGGVAAGSLAAKIQAAFYGGAATGVFSSLQSAGAGGIGKLTNLFIGGGGGYVGSYFCDDLELPYESPESLPETKTPVTNEPRYICDAEGVQCRYIKGNS